MSMRYNLHRCHNCDLQFWAPLEAPPEDYYNSAGGPIKSPYYLVMHGVGYSDLPQHQRAFFEGEWRQGASVLDIGCGDGSFLLAAHSIGLTGLGIDLDEQSVATAQRRGARAVAVSLADFRRSEGNESSFDIVTAFEVIEHQTNPVEALTCMRDLLRPGGSVAGTVPNRNRFKLFGHVDSYDFPPHHFLWFNVASLTRCLELAGFEQISVEIRLGGFRTDQTMGLVGRGLRSIFSFAPNSSSFAEGPSGGLLSPFHTLKALGSRCLKPLRQAEAEWERRTGSGASLYFRAVKSADNRLGHLKGSW